MEIALLVVALLLVVVCTVALMSLVRQVRALAVQIESLEGQVFRLTEQVQEQESRLEEMNREEAPAGIVPFVSSLSKSDGKSAFPTLALLGIRLLAAYLQRRRAKAPESTN
jgi:predicted PurR-regulated permease PerM